MVTVPASFPSALAPEPTQRASRAGQPLAGTRHDTFIIPRPRGVSSSVWSLPDDVSARVEAIRAVCAAPDPDRLGPAAVARVLLADHRAARDREARETRGVAVIGVDAGDHLAAPGNHVVDHDRALVLCAAVSAGTIE